MDHQSTAECGASYPSPLPCVQRICCPTNISVRTVKFWGLIENIAGLGTESIEYRMVCSMDTPVWTVFFEVVVVRWTWGRGGYTSQHSAALFSRTRCLPLRAGFRRKSFDLYCRQALGQAQSVPQMVTPPPSPLQMTDLAQGMGHGAPVFLSIGRGPHNKITKKQTSDGCVQRLPQLQLFSHTHIGPEAGRDVLC